MSSVEGCKGFSKWPQRACLSDGMRREAYGKFSKYLFISGFMYQSGHVYVVSDVKSYVLCVFIIQGFRGTFFARSY